MSKFVCPICGGSEKCTKSDPPGYFSFFRCDRGFAFGVADDILEMPPETQDRLYNLILEHLLYSPKFGKKDWCFFYEPTEQKDDANDPQSVNLAEALQSYPADLIEQANRTLFNLSVLYPRYSDEFYTEYIDIHASFCTGDNAADDAQGFFTLMVELGYLMIKGTHQNIFAISANGWKKIDALKKQRQEIKQGFIAMSFGDETNFIRNAFHMAIEDSGYAARLIDEKEHNNQIVPEIFYEIQRSKFVVVDVTYPNYGAYYEAGYAQGIGKEVIVCCKKDVFENTEGKYERPHFDISQKSIVIWEDEKDLIHRLKRRIEATVH